MPEFSKMLKYNTIQLNSEVIIIDGKSVTITTQSHEENHKSMGKVVIF